MIARHSYEQSGDGEGVEVIENKECEDDEHGKGQYTEKHIHLSRYGVVSHADMEHEHDFYYLFIRSRLPYWLQAVCPRVFYVIEKSWNYYPFTITGESSRRSLKSILRIYMPNLTNFSPFHAFLFGVDVVLCGFSLSPEYAVSLMQTDFRKR